VASRGSLLTALAAVLAFGSTVVAGVVVGAVLEANLGWTHAPLIGVVVGFVIGVVELAMMLGSRRE